jgi:enamine deaminase RidA (YjgF/YER057c/UK114 family)
MSVFISCFQCGQENCLSVTECGVVGMPDEDRGHIVQAYVVLKPGHTGDAALEKALQNIVDTLACAGAGPQHMARMTWYVKDKKEYLARGRELGKVYQEVIGKNYPAMTLVQVADLVEYRALVEIEVTAVVPE